MSDSHIAGPAFHPGYGETWGFHLLLLISHARLRWLSCDVGVSPIRGEINNWNMSTAR